MPADTLAINISRLNDPFFRTEPLERGSLFIRTKPLERGSLFFFKCPLYINSHELYSWTELLMIYFVPTWLTSYSSHAPRYEFGTVISWQSYLKIENKQS